MSSDGPGLLSPVSVGHDDLVSDLVVLDALVAAEAALVRAYVDVGVAPAAAEGAFGRAFFVDRGVRLSSGLDLAGISAAGVVGGNPVIPLVGALRERVDPDARVWVHRGATSQDILDTALMILSRDAVAAIRGSLANAAEWLAQLAERHRDDLAVARTLTQHAVPTTIGTRFAGWIRGLVHAVERLDALVFPAQLAGAGGTLASFVEVTGSADAARRLVVAYAQAARLATPSAPWQVDRTPVTTLGDAVAGALDAMGKIATDVATLGRAEIAEVAEGTGGGSSAMPQKQNPVGAVLVRSAALRAPHLAATLHTAAVLAGDERPDGAWHAEWPTLQELLRLALGAAWHTSSLCAQMRVFPDAAAANLSLSGGLVVSERLALVLGPILGKGAVVDLVAAAAGGGDLAALVRAAVSDAGADLDVDALVDPARYTGLASDLVDDAVRAARALRSPGGAT